MRFAIAITCSVMLFATAANAQSKGKVKKADPGTIYATIVDGLELIRDKKFEPFLDRYCHTEDLCFNENAKNSLRRYNLPAVSRLAAKCLKDARTLLVTRQDGDPKTDDTIKVFVVCDPRGMPRPFTVKKQDGKWKFKKI